MCPAKNAYFWIFDIKSQTSNFFKSKNIRKFWEVSVFTATEKSTLKKNIVHVYKENNIYSTLSRLTYMERSCWLLKFTPIVHKRLEPWNRTHPTKGLRANGPHRFALSFHNFLQLIMNILKLAYKINTNKTITDVLFICTATAIKHCDDANYSKNYLHFDGSVFQKLQP